MPTYEYECTECHRRLEIEQRFSDEPLTTCESCGGALRKVYSAVGVVFKGSGFYKTDSRPAAATPAATSSSSSKDSGGGSSESAAAATPAPKASASASE